MLDQMDTLMPIPEATGELSEEGHRYIHSSGVLMELSLYCSGAGCESLPLE